MKLFVSAVTSEFGLARSNIASDLRARGLTVKVQEDFRQESGAPTTLALLHNYIRDCDAVICIVGQRHGARPPQAAAQPYLASLPDGLVDASYTQWEFVFARLYGKHLSLHIASEGCRPDGKASGDENPGLQNAFIELIGRLGLNYTPFSTAEDMRIHILREDWPNLSKPRPISLPYGSLGPLFKGRGAMIAQLRSSLCGGGVGHLEAAITGKAIHGLGGVGKTRLAVEYAWHHSTDYSAIFCVTANTPQALQRNIAGLCGPLVLDLPERSIADEEIRFAAVLRWMQQHPGWLLILDNVDSEEAADASQRLLADLRRGHVILTSRLSTWGAGIATLELDVLDLDAATDFLLERTLARRRTVSDEQTHARTLASELGQLSLALEQAGAYISENRLAIKEYIVEWRENHAKVIDWFDERVMHYPRSVAVTWKTSVNLLSTPARNLLDRLAWFAPDPIPETLLKAPIANSSVGRMQDALSELERYSLVTRASGAATFSVHRLVQDVTRRSLVHEVAQGALADALRLFETFPRDSTDPATWPECSALLPHALATARHAEALGVAGEATARVMSEVGIYLWAQSDLLQARELHERALMLHEACFGPNSLAVSGSLNNLGLVLWDMVDLPGARQAHMRGLAIREMQLGASDPRIAASLNNLGSALWDLAQHSEARQVLERALAILDASLLDDQPAKAACLSNLGAVLCDLAELNAAMATYRRALTILSKQDRREDSVGAPAAPHGSGEFAVARAVLEPCLVLRRRWGIGRKLRPSFSLPTTRKMRGRNARVTSINTSAGFGIPLGGDHPTAVKIFDNIGVLLSVAGDFRAARATFESVLRIREERLGKDHPDVGWSLTNLGVVLACTGKLDEAKGALERGLAIRQVRLVADHPDVATNLSCLGTLLGGLGDLASASAMLERALSIRETRLGAAHPATTRTRENLTVVLGLARRRGGR